MVIDTGTIKEVREQYLKLKADFDHAKMEGDNKGAEQVRRNAIDWINMVKKDGKLPNYLIRDFDNQGVRKWR